MQGFSWLRRLDLNQRPSGYHFVPVAVVCRKLSPRRLGSVCSHFGRHRSQKTVHRTVFASLTQRATLAGLITRKQKYLILSTKKPALKAGWWLGRPGVVRATFGLSLRAGCRRVSQTIASQAWFCLLALWATPLTKNSPPDCFHLANPTSHARRSHNP